MKEPPQYIDAVDWEEGPRFRTDHPVMSSTLLELRHAVDRTPWEPKKLSIWWCSRDEEEADKRKDFRGIRAVMLMTRWSADAYLPTMRFALAQVPQPKPKTKLEFRDTDPLFKLESWMGKELQRWVILTFPSRTTRKSERLVAVVVATRYGLEAAQRMLGDPEESFEIPGFRYPTGEIPI